MAIEFEALGWQDKQGNRPALALSLNGGLEPAAAIHLDGPGRKGYTLLEGVQDPSNCSGHGLGVHVQDIPVGHHVSGSDLS